MRLLLVFTCSGIGLPNRLAAATLGKASTARATRELAVTEIPFPELTREAQEKIAAVVNKPSMFRRMPINVIDCDPELHRFLIRHPEVVVNIWQLMGITKVDTSRTGPYTLNASDGVGTECTVELVYGTNDTHLIYCEGTYDGPLFRNTLTGRCVLLLRTGVKAEENRHQISDRLDVFLQVDHAAVDVLTKTLHPLFGQSADLNFIESTKFLERVSHTAERNGPGMQRLAGRMDKIAPEIRDRFAQITADIYERAQSRTAEDVDSPSEEDYDQVDADRQAAALAGPRRSMRASQPSPAGR